MAMVWSLTTTFTEPVSPVLSFKLTFGQIKAPNFWNENDIQSIFLLKGQCHELHTSDVPVETYKVQAEFFCLIRQIHNGVD